MGELEKNSVRINEVFYRLATKGTDAYYGEAVTQLEHALQAAHHAKLNTDNDDVVLAALLHDIGHLLEPGQDSNTDHSLLGNQDHDRLGGEYLKRLGFKQNITDLVEHHVQAKRYLVSTDSAYNAKLSEASKQTLVFQGGPMWPEEIEKFEAQENFDDMILIRMCDEMAKVTGMIVDGLETYREMIDKHLG